MCEREGRECEELLLAFGGTAGGRAQGGKRNQRGSRLLEEKKKIEKIEKIRRSTKNQERSNDRALSLSSPFFLRPKTRRDLSHSGLTSHMTTSKGLPDASSCVASSHEEAVVTVRECVLNV